MGGGVAALSFDEEFQRRRIRRRRESRAGEADGSRAGGEGARGAARMMAHAVRDLGGGIYHGVTGIIVEPYKRTRVSEGTERDRVRRQSSFRSLESAPVSFSSR